MVQFFETEGDPRLGQLGQALGGLFGVQAKKSREQEQSKALADILFPDEKEREQAIGLLPEQQIALAKTRQKQQEIEQKRQILEGILGRPFSEEDVQKFEDQGTTKPSISKKSLGGLSDENISLLGVYDPNLARIAQTEKKQNIKNFQDERTYHTKTSDKYIEKLNDRRESLPQKRRALKFARESIESGDVGEFSLSRMGEYIGGPIGDALQSAKGAQLVTASKENLLGNLGRVSARAQNRWMEERINSMFGKVGQSQEANLSAQELLEGESLLEEANLSIADALIDQDIEKTTQGEFSGYAKRDIQKRVSKELEPLDDIIQERTSYRLREIYEREKGINQLRSEVGTKVPKGTPLTLQMRNLYRQKFGDNYEKQAKQNGYYIPSNEAYKVYELSYDEFRKKIGMKYE